MDEQQSFTWFVGIFEGEGCFQFANGRAKALTISMTDLDVLERVQAIVGGTIYPLKKRQDHWKDAWRWVATGQVAFDTAQRMHPYLGERRALRCKEYLSVYRSVDDYNASRKEQSVVLADLVLEKREEGLTHAAIADMLDLDRTYVTKILNKHGVRGRKARQ